MSLENHPNFHSCKFVADIVESYYACLRGKGLEYKIDIRKDLLLRFVEEIEKDVDTQAEARDDA
jgi:hypothetical protein